MLGYIQIRSVFSTNQTYLSLHRYYYTMADIESGKIDGVEYKYDKGDVVRFKFNGDEYTLEIIGFVKIISNNPQYKFKNGNNTMFINEKDIIEQVE